MHRRRERHNISLKGRVSNDEECRQTRHTRNALRSGSVAGGDSSECRQYSAGFISGWRRTAGTQSGVQTPREFAMLLGTRSSIGTCCEAGVGKPGLNPEWVEQRRAAMVLGNRTGGVKQRITSKLTPVCWVDGEHGTIPESDEVCVGSAREVIVVSRRTPLRCCWAVEEQAPAPRAGIRCSSKCRCGGVGGAEGGRTAPTQAVQSTQAPWRRADADSAPDLNDQDGNMARRHVEHTDERHARAQSVVTGEQNDVPRKFAGRALLMGAGGQDNGQRGSRGEVGVATAPNGHENTSDEVLDYQR
ncbi:hypothetical protein HYPSUDRAFT_55116 [Hypholoma sublateritium FD-334 SS-4]|uniref:Uncharacterized protein n=1 Tax=Hypholoma sublateritium (strain FD-334 SS-4) TaxID=945553 RepID=A0A0D2NZS7_HYPSF|nr:hypothetical protein HYPSUDRAFT_55116 [Hypholoma sublateritium FD-334 SS-4]